MGMPGQLGHHTGGFPCGAIDIDICGADVIVEAVRRHTHPGFTALTQPLPAPGDGDRIDAEHSTEFGPGGARPQL